MRKVKRIAKGTGLTVGWTVALGFMAIATPFILVDCKLQGESFKDAMISNLKLYRTFYA